MGTDLLFMRVLQARYEAEIVVFQFNQIVLLVWSYLTTLSIPSYLFYDVDNSSIIHWLKDPNYPIHFILQMLIYIDVHFPFIDIRINYVNSPICYQISFNNTSTYITDSNRGFIDTL